MTILTLDRFQLISLVQSLELTDKFVIKLITHTRNHAAHNEKVTFVKENVMKRVKKQQKRDYKMENIIEERGLVESSVKYSLCSTLKGIIHLVHW